VGGGLWLAEKRTRRTLCCI